MGWADGERGVARRMVMGYAVVAVRQFLQRSTLLASRSTLCGDPRATRLLSEPDQAWAAAEAPGQPRSASRTRGPILGLPPKQASAGAPSSSAGAGGRRDDSRGVLPIGAMRLVRGDCVLGRRLDWHVCCCCCFAPPAATCNATAIGAPVSSTGQAVTGNSY
jgi:hypothetical protein